MPCSPYEVIVIGAEDSGVLRALRALQQDFAALEIAVISGAQQAGRNSLYDCYLSATRSITDMEDTDFIMRLDKPRVGGLMRLQAMELYEWNFSEPAEYPDRNGNKSRNPMCPSGGRQYQKRRGKGRM